MKLSDEKRTQAPVTADARRRGARRRRPPDRPRPGEKAEGGGQSHRPARAAPGRRPRPRVNVVRARRAGVLLWKRVTIAVTAPDKLWVNGAGAALELGLAPDFRIVIADDTRAARRGDRPTRARRRARPALRPQGRLLAAVRRGTGPPHAGRHGAVPGQRRQRHGAGDRQGADRSPDHRGQLSEPPRPESIAALHADHHRPLAVERDEQRAAWAPPPRTRRPR